ncbi:hypothetical protein [Gelidibacter japonicus]|uniref:hypothetical protein n=1 Tax=Gelidibacter japonicus TaxID=1962232 RepID=UPI0013D86059|nr:hypothetical protein [Gelidibacter japonicus]
MKTFKTTIALAILLILSSTNSNSQNQSFWIHADQVKPSKQAMYEQVTKDFIEACKKHDLKDSNWSTARVDDGTYLSITPIANMADLDKNPLAPLMEKMGEEKFRDIFKRFNECYDQHGDYIVHLISDLSYMPNGLTPDTPGQNYRKWHFLYVTPSNVAALRSKIKEIKNLYEKKGSKEYFRIYRSGFGTMGDYFLATVSAKDEQSYSMTSDQNDVLLGEEGKKLFTEMSMLLDRYELKTGEMKPELSYTNN